MQQSNKYSFWKRKKVKIKRHRGSSRETKAKLVGDTSEECWTDLVTIYTFYICTN